MKTFFSEYRQDYKTYTFGYSIYAYRESPGETDLIYEQGFLPYTDDLRLPPHLFYKARSIRIDLDHFSNTSENRRVHRKVDPHIGHIEGMHRALFDTADQHFREFCMRFAEARFSYDTFSADRLEYILHPEQCTHIFTIFDEEEQPIGYVLAQLGDRGFHYWFSFYDLELGDEVPLGKWMMWRLIHWAKRLDKKYVYLGTCYGPGALYKVRDFEGVEFHTGNRWSDDIDALKDRAKSDGQEKDRDWFKQLDDPNSYLNQL